MSSSCYRKIKREDFLHSDTIRRRLVRESIRTNCRMKRFTSSLEMELRRSRSAIEREQNCMRRKLCGYQAKAFQNDIAHAPDIVSAANRSATSNSIVELSSKPSTSYLQGTRHPVLYRRTRVLNKADNTKGNSNLRVPSKICDKHGDVNKDQQFAKQGKEWQFSASSLNRGRRTQSEKPHRITPTVSPNCGYDNFEHEVIRRRSEAGTRSFTPLNAFRSQPASPRRPRKKGDAKLTPTHSEHGVQNSPDTSHIDVNSLAAMFAGCCPGRLNQLYKQRDQSFSHEFIIRDRQSTATLSKSEPEYQNKVVRSKLNNHKWTAVIPCREHGHG